MTPFVSFCSSARHCMPHGADEGKGEEMATEMMAAVGRLMRRG